jgi:hypothetical protein
MQTPGFAPSFLTHWASLVQGTQALLFGSQIGLAMAVQWTSAVHPTHAPVPGALSHAGVAARVVQAMSSMQAPHVLLVHTGRAAGQWLFTRHSTQRLPVTEDWQYRLPQSPSLRHSPHLDITQNRPGPQSVSTEQLPSASIFPSAV